jgi:hypothetical protein
VVRLIVAKKPVVLSANDGYLPRRSGIECFRKINFKEAYTTRELAAKQERVSGESLPLEKKPFVRHVAYPTEEPRKDVSFGKRRIDQNDLPVNARRFPQDNQGP